MKLYPWCFRVSDVSAWTKGSKMASERFLLMPMPVSLTEKTRWLPSNETVTAIYPLDVNLIELLGLDLNLIRYTSQGSLIFAYNKLHPCRQLQVRHFSPTKSNPYFRLEVRSQAQKSKQALGHRHRLVEPSFRQTNVSGIHNANTLFSSREKSNTLSVMILTVKLAVLIACTYEYCSSVRFECSKSSVNPEIA